MSETGGWASPDPDREPAPEGEQRTPPAGQPLPQAPPPPPNAGWGPGPGYGKPGVIPLRPLNLGEILDGAITTMRRYPGLVLGVSAVVAVITAGLNFVASLLTLDDLRNLAESANQETATSEQQLDEAWSQLGTTATAYGVTILVTVLTTTFLAGFLTVVVGKAVLGQPITVGQALAEVRPLLLRLLGLTIVYTLLVIVGVALCIVPGVWLYVLFGLSTPALILEKSKIGEAFTRSRMLVKGSWWRVFGILLLAAIIVSFISYLIVIPFSLASGSLSGMFSGTIAVPTVGGLLLESVGELIATAIATPFSAAVTALLYIDQRMRKEGMDIQLARAAGTAPPTW